MSWVSNRLGSAGALAALLLACGNPLAKQPEKMALNDSQQAPSPHEDARAGRLRARPGKPTVEPSAARGVQKLGLGGRRDGLLYVPERYRADRPAPLVVMLHGAGGNADHALDPLLKLADEAGLLLLAPDSRGPTWDVIMDDYGPDVAFLDGALAHVFARYAVDPERIAVEGFSDGASYALSLGVGNGDLFRHVIAFSPGFLAPVSVDEVIAALVLSQLAVTVGAFVVPVDALPGVSRELFLYGGLLFYPVYGLLTWQWFRRGTAWLGLAIFLWSAQGFFHVICRMRMVASA